MYLTINKNNLSEYYNFEWTFDNKLIINNTQADPNEWEIVETDIVERSSGYWIVDDYGVIDGPFLSMDEIKTK